MGFPLARARLPILTILLALPDSAEARLFQHELAADGHLVIWRSSFDSAKAELQHGGIDLLIANEHMEVPGARAGVQLVQICRDLNQIRRDNRRTVAVLLRISSEDQFRGLGPTGAHVVPKQIGPDILLAYIRGFTFTAFSDELNGPFLYGFHLYLGEKPYHDCHGCEWVGAAVSYQASWQDFNLRPTEAQTINILFARRRGLSPLEMERLVRENPFLSTLGGNVPFLATAAKMRVSRVRENLTVPLLKVAAPVHPSHFIPFVSHGYGRYRLAGHWALIHIKKAPH